MYCRFCGNQLDGDDIFCPKCGNKIVRTKHKTKKNFAFFCNVILFVGILFIAIYFAGNHFFRPKGLIFISNDIYSSLGEEEHIVVNQDAGVEYFDNELLIYASGDDCEKQIQKLVKHDGGKIVGKNNYVDSFQIRFGVPRTYNEYQELIEKYEQQNYIDKAFLNLVVHFEESYYPVSDEEKDLWKNEWNETPKGGNWGLEAIRAPQAWAHLDSMQDVEVGVFDSGCDIDHVDLRNVIEDSLVEKDRGDGAKHGTLVSGIIAADFYNKNGIVGVSPTAKLAVVDFYASRKKYTSMDTYIGGYTWMIAEKKCKVINMSIGTEVQQIAASYGNRFAQNEMEEMAKELETALTKWLRKEETNDFLIFAAAGNANAYEIIEDENTLYGYYMVRIGDQGREYYEADVFIDENADNYKLEKRDVGLFSKKHQGGIDAKWGSPISMIENEELKNRIIIVGNAQNDGKTAYSLGALNVSGERIDLIAPGTDILSTVSEDKYTMESGTSLAAPFATGVGALLYSIKPDLDAAEAKKIILETADIPVEGTDRKMVNAEAAVKRLLEKYPGSVTGCVCEEDSEEGITDVIIEAVRRSEVETVYGQSNADGTFNIELEADYYTIYFSKNGYKESYVEDIQVKPGVPVDLDSVYLSKTTAISEVQNGQDQNSQQEDSGNPAYARYRQLILEYEEKYGEVGTYQPYEGRMDLTGLCFAKLVDFNHDGTEELLTIYSIANQQNELLTYDYVYEIWEYRNDTIDMIDTGGLYGTNGGIQTVNLAHYNDQTYLVTGGSDSFAYNYYHGYHGAEFGIVHETLCDDLFDSSGTFTIDGQVVSREQWNQEENLWHENCEYYTLNSDNDSANAVKDVLEETKTILGISSGSDCGEETAYIPIIKKKYQADDFTEDSGYDAVVNYEKLLNGTLSKYSTDFNGDGMDETVEVKFNSISQVEENEHGRYTRLTSSIDIELYQMNGGQKKLMDSLSDVTLTESNLSRVNNFQVNYFIYRYEEKYYLATDLWSAAIDGGRIERIVLYQVDSEFHYIRAFGESESVALLRASCGNIAGDINTFFLDIDEVYSYDIVARGNYNIVDDEAYANICHIREEYSNLLETYGLKRKEGRFWKRGFPETLNGVEKINEIYSSLEGEIIWSAGVKQYYDENVWYETYDDSPDAISYRTEEY